MNKKKIKRSPGDLERDIFLDQFLESIFEDMEKNFIPMKKAPEIWAIGLENFLLFRWVVRKGN